MLDLFSLNSFHIYSSQIYMWLQLHDLPFGCMNVDGREQFGVSLGRVKEVDVDTSGNGWGQAPRVKVEIDITKPLMRGRMPNLLVHSSGLSISNMKRFHTSSSKVGSFDMVQMDAS